MKRLFIFVFPISLQKTDRHAFNSYKDRYKYTQDLKRDSQQAIQRRNRKNRAYRHRKEEYSDNLATTGSDEDGETLEIPSIENIRLAGTTQRKLLERRISLLRTQDKIAHLESRFSDRGSQDLNVYQPASSHSSRRTRTINTAIPEVVDTEGSEYGAAMNNVQIVRKTARNHRDSVLKKAERLLHERKRHDFGSSSEADTEDSPRLSVHTQRSSRLARPSTYIARSRSRSLSSEKEYIHVPEVLDSVSDTNDFIDNDPAKDSRNAIQALPDVNRLYSNQRRKRFYLKSAAQVGLLTLTTLTLALLNLF